MDAAREDAVVTHGLARGFALGFALGCAPGSLVEKSESGESVSEKSRRAVADGARPRGTEPSRRARRPVRTSRRSPIRRGEDKHRWSRAAPRPRREAARSRRRPRPAAMDRRATICTNSRELGRHEEGARIRLRVRHARQYGELRCARTKSRFFRSPLQKTTRPRSCRRRASRRAEAANAPTRATGGRARRTPGAARAAARRAAIQRSRRATSASQVRSRTKSGGSRNMACVTTACVSPRTTRRRFLIRAEAVAVEQPSENVTGTLLVGATSSAASTSPALGTRSEAPRERRRTVRGRAARRRGGRATTRARRRARTATRSRAERTRRCSGARARIRAARGGTSGVFSLL